MTDQSENKMTEVFVSLTTIPSRTDYLKRCLDSLIHQEYAITQIFLTIPERTLRTGQRVSVPEFLSESPYDKWVTVIRPKKDYGPIMKYIGSYKHVTKDSAIFICDDDQEYHPTLVKKLMQKYISHGETSVITAMGETILTTNTVFGHAGVIVPAYTIPIIRNEVLRSNKYIRKSCQLVDDNWVSIIFKKYNIKVINMGLSEKERYIHGVNSPSDGLCKTTNRMGDVMRCTYAIDHTNTFPVVALILFLLFVLIVVVNYYYVSYL